MPRLKQVSRDQVYPNGRKIYDAIFGDRDPVATPGTATGTPGNWWTVFANVPDCLDHAVSGFGLYRSSRRKLDPKLRELGQIRAGFARQSQFVFSQHCKACRAVGVKDEQVAAIRTGRRRRASRRSSARCSRTRTAWCSRADACPTACSRRCARTSRTWRSSSSPT